MEVTKARFCVDLASKVGNLQKYAYSMVIYTVYIIIYWLVLGTWLLFSILYGMSSFPFTFIFFKMVKTTNQYISS